MQPQLYIPECCILGRVPSSAACQGKEDFNGNGIPDGPSLMVVSPAKTAFVLEPIEPLMDRRPHTGSLLRDIVKSPLGQQQDCLFPMLGTLVVSCQVDGQDRNGWVFNGRCPWHHWNI
jgi:hypothetical protein